MAQALQLTRSKRQSVRRNKFLSAVIFRAKWRAALVRCEVDARCVSVLAVAERDDGGALTVTLRSKTPEGMAVFSERGIDRLSWSLNRRVVLLPSEPFTPNVHRILVEHHSFEVGDLPTPPVKRPAGIAYRVLLGKSAVTGELVTADLWTKERGSVHALVAGTTGGGKSNTVNVLLAGLVGHGVCVVGIDCKAGETLQPWAGFLGCNVVDPISQPDKADGLLERLIALMEERHRCPGPNYQPVVLVVEEWASLPTKPTSIGDNLERLAAQGRSASIGLIVTTQRPTSNVGAVRTSTRGNLPLRIAHSTVGDRAASEAILGGGEYAAAELPTTPPGHALLRNGGGAAESVRVFRCIGPPWKPGELNLPALNDVEAWDRVAQREVTFEREWLQTAEHAGDFE